MPSMSSSTQQPQTRSTSFTSTASDTSLANSSTSSSSSSSTTYLDLESRALTLLDLLCNKHDLSTASTYIHPEISTQHNDNPPILSREAFLSGWETTLQRTPGLNIHVKEACVDEVQRKVWVWSEIDAWAGVNNEEGEMMGVGRRLQQPQRVRKESVDMLSFDEDGLVIGSMDCQRVVRRRGRLGREEDSDDEE